LSLRAQKQISRTARVFDAEVAPDASSGLASAARLVLYKHQFAGFAPLGG